MFEVSFHLNINFSKLFPNDETVIEVRQTPIKFKIEAFFESLKKGLELTVHLKYCEVLSSRQHRIFEAFFKCQQLLLNAGRSRL